MTKRIITIGRHVVKLPLNGASLREMLRENDGYREATMNDFFSKDVYTQRRYGRVVVVSDKAVPAQVEDKAKGYEYLFQKLVLCQTMKKENIKFFADTIWREECDDLFQILRPDNVIDKNIDGLEYVLSPGHGDLHIANMLLADGRIKLIDWASYRDRSSFYFDIVHFMIHFICLDQGKKWYQLKYTDITEHDEFAIISNKIDLQKAPLLLGHLLNRVFLEVRQLGGFRKLKLKHRNRYTKIFLNLMHEIELVKSKGPSMTLTGPICEG